MLRERAKFITRAHKVLDICLTASAFVAAYFIKRLLLPEPLRGLSVAPNYYIVLLMIIIIWYVSFAEEASVYEACADQGRQMTFLHCFAE